MNAVLKRLGAAWRFFRLLLSSESRKRAMEQFEQMRKDGVDPLDQSQRKDWIRRHRAVLSRELPGVYSRAMPSRNDHCPCGSRKKYKRCCGRQKGD